jgi:hypothetical protein
VLAERHRWLRVADEAWGNPFDTAFAERHGGRWNPPASFPVLYLNEDLDTARDQIRKLLAGSPVGPEDLDPPFVLVVARLPGRQIVADAVTDDGLAALGLPKTYPRDATGEEITHEVCQPIGVAVKNAGLRGVRPRSAATADGSGIEFAWLPARRSSKATQVGTAIPFHRWWTATSLP